MLTNEQINQITQQVAVSVAAALSGLTTPSNVIPLAKPKASKKVAAQPKADPALTKRHASIVSKFQARGIKDPKLFTDIKTYQGWLLVGRQVKANSKSVQGLFHITQTDKVGA